MLKRNLKKLMDEREISQYALAQQTGVPQSSIQRMLAGKTGSPKAESVNKLAKFFGVKPAALRGEDKDMDLAIDHEKLKLALYYARYLSDPEFELDLTDERIAELAVHFYSQLIEGDEIDIENVAHLMQLAR